MMPLKKDIKLVRSLHQKKFRSELGLFLAEGKKMVEEALVSGFEIHSVYSTDAEWAARNNAMVLTAKEMDSVSALNTSSPYLAVLKQKVTKDINPVAPLVLILDGISDPGNLGTILRTAEWFNIRSVFCAPDTVDLFNPKVVQSTMGSIFRMEVKYDSEAGIVQWCRTNGYEIAGADMNGKNVFEYSFSSRTALVIGSESHGIREFMRSSVDNLLHIPGNGDAESLNAAVAAGIILSHWFKQSR